MYAEPVGAQSEGRWYAYACRGWKDLVDEWVKSAGDVAAAAMAGNVRDVGFM